MPSKKLSTYSYITATGTTKYCDEVLECLRTIRGLQDGRKVFDRIEAAGFPVEIVDVVGKGNSTSYNFWRDIVPILTLAIDEKNSAIFERELTVAMGKAVSGGMTIEHFARQLANGLTPATYTGATNVVRPSTAWVSALLPKATAKQTMDMAQDQTAKAKGILRELMAGSLSVNQLPVGWDYELPRLLRQYLTPGPGGPATVKFNPEMTFACKDDPAMHERPPTMGLAHEMIHAMHAAEGTNMRLVSRNNQRLEELITTGMAPYQYEAISDNKMRTQWPSFVALRENYTTAAGTTRVKVQKPA